MNKSEAIERVERLRELINDYRYHYHVLDESIMTEAAADSLKHELSQLEEQFPELITADSPTQRVAGEVAKGFEKVEHSTRMLSLNDVFNTEEIQNWITRVNKLMPGKKHDYFVDLKMDGLACSLIYQDGVLVQAVTRGNGFIGENVTQNIKTIKNIPLRLRHSKTRQAFLTGRTEIRGEVVMYKTDFDALNKKQQQAGLPLFANPRNLAAGTIRQLDAKLVDKRPLHFHAYDIIRDNPKEVPSYATAYETIADLGITRNKQATVVSALPDLEKFIQEWTEKRHNLNFNTDGMVVKINDRELYSQLGVVGKAPRGAVAFKYPAEQSTSVVKDIVISIGRTGAATPVAVFNPVVVAGSTVQHASLHNADEIARKDIRVGDTVVIYKAGDIIPQVESVILGLRPKSAKKLDFETELKRQYPELSFERPDDEVVYRVKGASGPLILKRALEHYASKGALDIDTLGEKNVEALVDAGLVEDVADIYQLSFEKVIKLERFADLSTKNLITAIAQAKNPTLARFIYGLGIRHVGEQTAIDLAEHFTNLSRLAEATIDELRLVNGIGEVVAESIVAWFANEENTELLKKFTALGVAPQHHSSVGGKLTGQSFVVTGTLESMGRDLAAEKIRALGGTFQSSVGKDTTYLVAGGRVGEGKLKKAKMFGVKIISEAELLELL